MKSQFPGTNLWCRPILYKNQSMKCTRINLWKHSPLPLNRWQRFFLAHGLTASLHLDLHFFLFSRFSSSQCEFVFVFVILKGKITDLTFLFGISLFMFVIVFGFVILGQKIINGSLWFWFWAWLGMRGQGPRRPNGAGSGLRKKIRLINGLGLGFWDRPASRVRIWKNPAQTQLIAIPSHKLRERNNKN